MSWDENRYVLFATWKQVESRFPSKVFHLARPVVGYKLLAEPANGQT